MTRKKQNPRRLRSVLGAATIASFVAAALFTPSAATADIIGSYTADVTTVAQGDTVTFTFTMSYYGNDTTNGDITYFCGDTQNADTSDTTLPTSSATLVLLDENNEVFTTPNSVVSGNLADPTASDWVFDGPGIGQFNFNENPYTGPLEFEFTIPNSIPAGDYMVVLGCVSPGYFAVQSDGDYFNSPVLPLTVTAPETPSTPAPETPSTPSNLPTTGENDVSNALVGTFALAAIATGVAVFATRRRITRRS